jgi:hypothetical protein
MDFVTNSTFSFESGALFVSGLLTRQRASVADTRIPFTIHQHPENTS